MNSIITVLASAVSIFGISMQGFAQSLGSREDEIAIRAVIVDMTDGFNNHDDGSTEPRADLKLIVSEASASN
jgi:hypothetical protein